MKNSFPNHFNKIPDSIRKEEKIDLFFGKNLIRIKYPYNRIKMTTISIETLHSNIEYVASDFEDCRDMGIGDFMGLRK